jgi:general stress protein YciG
MANTSKRGFASMDGDKQRQIASKGGRAAHAKGTAHEWTSEEARAAGRKGGESRGTRPQDSDIPVGQNLATGASFLNDAGSSLRKNELNTYQPAITENVLRAPQSRNEPSYQDS